MSEVLVTGGSGFVGVHCILQLLQAGHTVRTTVRSLKREGAVRAMLAVGGVGQGSPEAERLSFFEADLTEDAGWAKAMAGCEFVHHVASPFPSRVPKDDDELVKPAREGTLRVLKAARDAGVKRVVVTSSFAAIGYGLPPQAAPYDETNWTNVDGPGVGAYTKSKTLAERAAWDFVEKEGGGMELATVNPVGIFGPVLGPELSTSMLIVQKMMDGALPGSPRLAIGAVDVRDVADLHLRAMVDPKAKGERFLAVAGDFVSLKDLGLMMRARLGEAARRVPTRELPNWIVRAAALLDPAVKLILPELGKEKNATNAKARRVLGWQPRTTEDAVVASAESLMRLGLLKR